MNNESIDPEDVVSYDVAPDRERDGVASLRDTDAEQGDEEGLDDELVLDQVAAREGDVDLDRLGGESPRLD